ncbi:hypothetical protein [Gilvimarinus xylanilyticus]|uniref:Transcriptional regulator SutA RNAP-binding domain-containing protein n=1 Tax=Gilvimarinus xylanilyticus TaxID=2944139 RepID=A0A9X2I428_9GAMM|nr:hypothetical protein [Gilvimarinus xylanilyticus]MCP8899990.1 hypothetical protein [Gilvimarinus xylanilyticus]
MASQYELDETRNLDRDEELDSEDSDTVETASESTGASSEDFNIASRERLRTELSQQVEAFLARGGKINEIPNQSANNRPGKPASDYTGSYF